MAAAAAPRSRPVASRVPMGGTGTLPASARSAGAVASWSRRALAFSRSFAHRGRPGLRGRVGGRSLASGRTSLGGGAIRSTRAEPVREIRGARSAPPQPGASGRSSVRSAPIQTTSDTAPATATGTSHCMAGARHHGLGAGRSVRTSAAIVAWQREQEAACASTAVRSACDRVPSNHPATRAASRHSAPWSASAARLSRRSLSNPFVIAIVPAPVRQAPSRAAAASGPAGPGPRPARRSTRQSAAGSVPPTRAGARRPREWPAASAPAGATRWPRAPA